MNEIKRLQKLLTDGKISKAEYKKQLKELLEDEDITQEEHDDAEDFEGEGTDPDDKPVYSQNDVDRMIIPKARKLVKKQLKDAGVDLTGVSNKDLLEKLGEWAVSGQKKGNLDVNEQELTDLQRKAKAYDESTAATKSLLIENAVLKAADKYKAVNPKQVVRALSDYEDLLEYDDNDQIIPKSVDKALGKLVEAEPNLFQTADTTEIDEDDETLDNDDKTQFGGKGPGGGAGNSNKKQQRHQKRKAEALDMLGLGKKEE